MTKRSACQMIDVEHQSAEPPEATARARMLAEVDEGLRRDQKEIPPKYFYDQRGSKLFEEITNLPEYYLTRAERRLLESWTSQWIDEFGPVTLVELGAGSAEKTRILLEAMQERVAAPTYVPIDISEEFLAEQSTILRKQYPRLQVIPVATDMTTSFQVPADLGRPAIIALLGSTIGNFEPGPAARLLGQARSAMTRHDRFLMGVDLEKDAQVLERAYNDARGTTARFNLNLLRVLNRELGADFDLQDFQHQAFYNADEHRIEMHLVARRGLTVTIPGAGSYRFASGETIRTEISCKFDRQRVADLFLQSGFTIDRWVVGADGFALVMGTPMD